MHGEPHSSIFVEIVEDFWVYHTHQYFETQQGGEREREKCQVDAPVEPVVSAPQSNERGEQQQRDSRNGELERQNHLRAREHGECPCPGFQFSPGHSRRLNQSFVKS